jgi:hypothetical protein
VLERLRAARRSAGSSPSGILHRRARGQGDYRERHGKLLSWALDDGELDELLRSGKPLPQRYGVGVDERVIEYPWLYRSVRSGAGWMRARR